VADVGLDLRKKTVQSLGRSNGALQGAALSVSNNVLRGLLETNPVSGAVRT
jgi:hypothetical protein